MTYARRRPSVEATVMKCKPRSHLSRFRAEYRDGAWVVVGPSGRVEAYANDRNDAAQKAAKLNGEEA